MSSSRDAGPQAGQARKAPSNMPSTLPSNAAESTRASGTGAATAEERILERVCTEVGPDRYARFFDRQARLSLGPAGLDVTVPNGFAAQLLDRRFGDVLRRAADETVGRHADESGPRERPATEVRFRVDGGAFGKEGPAAAPVAATAVPTPRVRRPGADTPSLNLRHRLEDFVVGESNRLAHSAAEEFCREGGGGGRMSPLFIHGACGVGKTHLVQGIAARCHERAGRSAVVRYTTAEAFTNEFITAVKARRIDAFRKGYRAVDVLCIDDVHFLSAKHGTQTELLHTFDALGQGGARVVMASDAHPRAIQKMSDSLASRFMAGLVVGLEAPEPGLRERIVRTLGERRGLPIDRPAARLIASWPGAGASVRDLEGLVTRVEAVARLLSPSGQRPAIDAATAARALGMGAGGDRRGSSGPRRPIRADAIAGEVCRAMGVESQELCGRGRHARVVLARALAVYLCRRLTTLSFPEIARALGRPNHSSVITAFRRVEGQMRDGVSLPDLGGLALGDLAAQLEDRLARGAAPA
jgi:chromosomal replication initiator protein